MYRSSSRVVKFELVQRAKSWSWKLKLYCGCVVFRPAPIKYNRVQMAPKHCLCEVQQNACKRWKAPEGVGVASCDPSGNTDASGGVRTEQEKS